MAQYIDFRALRHELDFGQVLEHYGVELKVRGKQHHGFCPLPNHPGKRNSESFSANLERKIWQCFGCQGKGNLLDFAVIMTGGNPQNGEDVRRVALDLKHRFLADAQESKTVPLQAVSKPDNPVETKQDNRPRVINAPLQFELKLDPEHPYLKERGFSPETITHFGLGFCAKGMLAGRIAIPLHDHEGQLIGYAGRLVDQSKISRDNPKYRFPGSREEKGSVFEFQKSRFLCNGYRWRGLKHLTVVEGFPSVWWLTQQGFPHTVALMGATVSDAQAKLILDIVQPRGQVWIFTDGNKAGERCANELFEKIAPYRAVHWVRLFDERQPTDCSKEKLQKLAAR